YLALRNFYDDSPAAALTYADLSGEYAARETLTAAEWQQVLQRGMQTLNERERQIIALVAFEGRSVREAAQQMKESYVNGRNLYYRGLRKMRQQLPTMPLIGPIDSHKSRKIRLGRFSIHELRHGSNPPFSQQAAWLRRKAYSGVWN